MCVIQDWYDEIIVVIEVGLLCEVLVCEQLEFVVLMYLCLFLIQGMGLCVLVLFEGWKDVGYGGQDFGEGFVELQCCYIVLLMDLFVCGQQVGEVCGDILLCLLCFLVFGLMEYMFWEVVIIGWQLDVEVSVCDLVVLLWLVFQVFNQELCRLCGLCVWLQVVLVEI